MNIKNNSIRILLFSVFLTTAIQCTHDCVLEERCTAGPIESPCLASIPRYYYDQSDKKCKKFTWGGCSEIIPFETMAECEQHCHCK